MVRKVLLILFALILQAICQGGESGLDDALLSGARKDLPREIVTNELAKVLQGGLWNSNRTAFAVSVPHPKASVIFVFLRRADGTFIASDASGVEGGNFGKLGRSRSDYDRFETTPIEWLPHRDDLFRVRMRTRAWRGGQRYTVSEDLVIKSDGTVLYR